MSRRERIYARDIDSEGEKVAGDIRNIVQYPGDVLNQLTQINANLIKILGALTGAPPPGVTVNPQVPTSTVQEVTTENGTDPIVVQIGITPTKIIAGDINRLLTILTNISSTTIYWGFTSKVAASGINQGVPLLPTSGGNARGDEFILTVYNGDIYGVVASGTGIVSVETALLEGTI